ncbi:protease inhibitor I42 family protein [Nocardia camponoti]|uniref:Proteinase inhibitor I42 chagasin domain-containing protein n=1 Tax=Nocardia camponoti TaxID=1616106 RepID=A0A917V6K4_9NOCA|nr:hypothetical protein [Nocardia camponoti]GGK44221.1 hypothetical protein GCM10011591_14710 [Nocardia camponoti]
MRAVGFVLVVGVVAGLAIGCAKDESGDTDITPSSLPLTTTSAVVAGPISVDESANNTTVNMVIGQRLTVRLPQNPDSLSTWVQVNEDPGTLIPDGGPQADGNATVWAFRAIQNGVTQVEFVFTAANRPPTNPDPTFSLQVQVR